MISIVELLIVCYTLLSSLAIIMAAIVDIYNKERGKSAFVDALLFSLLLGVGVALVILILLAPR